MNRIPENVIAQLEGLSCEDVAEKLGMDIKRHRTLCFMHDDHHPSLAFMGEDRKSWRCFVCNKGGNAIDLVRECMGYNFVEASLWLCAQYGINVGNEVPKTYLRKRNLPKRLVRAEEKKPFAKDVAQFVLAHCGMTDYARRFLFDERRLSPHVVENLNIVAIDSPWDIVHKMEEAFNENTLQESGLVSIVNGKMYLRLFTPCLLFPYYDRKGELIGLQSRYLGQNEEAPRFQFVSSQKTHLFNLPILETMRCNEELYISEGITDCLALLSSGKKAVAVPSATILPETDLMELTKYKLYMYPDQDAPGERAFMHLQRFFIKMSCFLRSMRLPEGTKDYSEYYKQQYGK